jgi:hypothetical protein
MIEQLTGVKGEDLTAIFTALLFVATVLLRTFRSTPAAWFSRWSNLSTSTNNLFASRLDAEITGKRLLDVPPVLSSATVWSLISGALRFAAPSVARTRQLYGVPRVGVGSYKAPRRDCRLGQSRSNPICKGIVHAFSPSAKRSG